ncbi:FdhF/YdeP family oxidoreductase [Colwellia hornerae]|uniref:FdhF/YdeP family oxidoreductase n=1 Tax=Colwellia hornerae TaxID=89402 RepID=A0A5C6QS48_9GAMM|nr:FdhF/YdeP family oxidoreductase [Colwellia hornerae]TWX57617.1 FdhF/YdeP family oxidoreductase [Colwellia hornerae]TWX62652.1 FdhF/YdeP family oxidoreductase [Colwellia hornerae]TWX71563.1 FdhF/YdeP family oxidoreductase [Colwellia hornerae]
MSKSSKNNPAYSSPAGGWGALRSSAKHLIQSENAAKSVKALLRANQPGGFDCPGCAWGDSATAGKVDFCENGVKAIAWEATSKRVDSNFFKQYSITELQQWDDHSLEKSGRLTEPMYYDGENDHYQPISWQEAFKIIGTSLQQLSSPNEALLYTSGRASNEVAYLYQLFGRVLGTNNFPDCSNMCHEASGIGMTNSLGTGKGTVTMDDFSKADAIFVFGQNPGTNHPRMLGTLREASKRGAKIVSVNNLKERGLQKFSDPQSPKEMIFLTGTTISQYYFTPRLGGDMALLRGVAKCLFEKFEHDKSVLDTDFINEHCHGFEAYRQRVAASDWDKILDQCSLTRENIEQIATIYTSSNKVIFTWAMGITQHRHSVATVRELLNVLMLRGNIGKAGAGACPVRGHSNVQGNRTMGINENPSMDFLDALEHRYSFSVPRDNGFNTVESIHAMLEGKAKVFIALGGNFSAATPDTTRTHKALKNCDLTVQISTKLNRSHVITGKRALILPCLGRTEIDRQSSGEQCITVEDSMSMVHSSTGQNEPAANTLRSETAIVAAIAMASVGDKIVDWNTLAGDYDLIRQEISAVIPGFDDYNFRIKAGRGFHLQNSAAQRHWRTPIQKAIFSDARLPEQLVHERAQLMTKKPVLTLQTLRSHDQYNTTIYGMDDRYRGVYGERNIIFMNAKDINKQALKNGDRVKITTVSNDGIARSLSNFKIVEYLIPPGCVAAYYPETNPLVPLESIADECGTPTYKSIPISIEKMDNQQ